MAIYSDQIITTSHDLGLRKVAFRKGNGTPAISGKSRLVKYYCNNLARYHPPNFLELKDWSALETRNHGVHGLRSMKETL